MFLEALNPVLADQSADEEHLTIARFVFKILIPNKDRSGCLRSLARMNVHAASLFPDLMGAAQYCNYRLGAGTVTDTPSEPEAPPVEPVIPLKKPPVATKPSRMAPPRGIKPLIRRALLTSGMPAFPRDVKSAVVAQIADGLQREMVIDWESREFAWARMRNHIRAVLHETGLKDARVLHNVATSVVDDLIDWQRAKLEAERKTQNQQEDAR